MRIPNLIEISKRTYKVYRTGLPFFDAARLIGVAHLFFGTASAEVEDKGTYWEISGIPVKRDENQIVWVIEIGKKKAHDLDQKKEQIKKALSETIAVSKTSFDGLPVKKGKAAYPALKEFDAAIQYGPRGIDPLRDAAMLSSRGTEDKKTDKLFRLSSEELIISSLGFSFSALIKSNNQRTYILPTFRGRFVLSGFMECNKYFTHPASGFTAEILGAISILLDLTPQKLPIVDFVYTRIYGRNTFSSSGYLGLEKLCSYWWTKVVVEKSKSALNLLKNIRLFLKNTSNPKTHDKVQELARWLANFVAEPSVNAINKIQQLKARIISASQDQDLIGANEAHNLFGKGQLLREVINIMRIELPEIPWQITETLARVISLDRKGWMNPFTRLENAGNFSQFIQQLENIISRGYYREQQENEESISISEALAKARFLADELRKIEEQLRDEKSFRAWRAIFLLDVLSRIRFQRENLIEGQATQNQGESNT